MRIIRHLQLQRAEIVAAYADAGGAVSVACAARGAAPEEGWDARVGVAGPWGGSAGPVDDRATAAAASAVVVESTLAVAAIVAHCAAADDVVGDATHAAAAAAAVADNADAATLAASTSHHHLVVAAGRRCSGNPRTFRLVIVFLPGKKNITTAA